MTTATTYRESVSVDERARSLRIRWQFVVLLVVGGVINYLDRGTLSIGNTTIAQDLGFSRAEMGLLLSAFAWPYAIANLPAGYLVDRFGPRTSGHLCLGRGFLVRRLHGHGVRS